MSGRWCLCVALWAPTALAAEPEPRILVRGDAHLHIRPEEDADTLDLNLRDADIDPTLDAVAFAFVDETGGWLHVRSIAQPPTPTCLAPQPVRRQVGAGLAPTFVLDLYVRADQRLSTAQASTDVPVCAPTPAGTARASEPAPSEQVGEVGGLVVYSAAFAEGTPLTWLDGTPAGQTAGMITLDAPKEPRPDGRVCFSTASTGPFPCRRWPALTVCAAASALTRSW